jgi:NAD(P)-dependent dehydrogenase (short-subunit alcohol dehydrogenase family)
MSKKPKSPMLGSPIMQGQTALVTGGGSGIGLAISRHFLLHGATVVIAARKADRLEAAQKNSNHWAPYIPSH